MITVPTPPLNFRGILIFSSTVSLINLPLLTAKINFRVAYCITKSCNNFHSNFLFYLLIFVSILGFWLFLSFCLTLAVTIYMWFTSTKISSLGLLCYKILRGLEISPFNNFHKEFWEKLLHPARLVPTLLYSLFVILFTVGCFVWGGYQVLSIVLHSANILI